VTDERVRGYANAILSIAEAEEDLDDVVEELFVFAKTFETNTQLREALIDPELPAENKGALIDQLVGERANRHTPNILKLIVDQGRARQLVRIVEEVARLAAERRRRVVAEVRAAVPLDEAQRVSLAEALSTATGRTVEVALVLDRNVIGGVVSRVGDEVIDGSVRARLEEAKEHLKERMTSWH
jgi:F-type H+-transporting ATPase subunit delta